MPKLKNQSKQISKLYKTGKIYLLQNNSIFFQRVIPQLKRSGEIREPKVGQITIRGLPLQVFKFFDKTFAELANKFKATKIIHPVIIPQEVLIKSEFLTSFPSIGLKMTNGYFLNPAICYHIYYQLENKILNDSILVFTSTSKCYRKEEKPYKPLERLQEFTMKEIVALGSYSLVEQFRKDLITEVLNLVEVLKLSGVVQKSFDLFFKSTSKNRGKKLLQQLKPLKFELQLAISPKKRIAVCSFNNHEEFFGRCFNINLKNGQLASSACVAFGLERWVLAFLSQHGLNPQQWPSSVEKTIKENG